MSLSTSIFIFNFFFIKFYFQIFFVFIVNTKVICFTNFFGLLIISNVALGPLPSLTPILVQRSVKASNLKTSLLFSERISTDKL